LRSRSFTSEAHWQRRAANGHGLATGILANHFRSMYHADGTPHVSRGSLLIRAGWRSGGAADYTRTPLSMRPGDRRTPTDMACNKRTSTPGFDQPTCLSVGGGASTSDLQVERRFVIQGTLVAPERISSTILAQQTAEHYVERRTHGRVDDMELAHETAKLSRKMQGKRGAARKCENRPAQ
jgi:hypothetical protein